MRKVVWIVTDDEKQEIKDIFEKKQALENLFKILTEENGIYKSVLKDYICTINNYNSWWNRMTRKYHCDNNIINKLVIDFNTNEVLYFNERGDDNV